ncbi:Eco57I restriction-modification methylase domain-containing protein [Paenibacillus sp. BR1-192]|uniref:Eco57I restriction-modification methylase domain-containing protein n=1 Tax=Paenibacillus sp. BR1-192 TaxID=3032287 RepID=UPI00240E3F04|nr:Eco57I restriction-modification methylase domain-containing protein [Paenibacillus sp. BR1-192]WFB59564.1 Eco57I restriction-modification methylase domain-containing protein [Paenibacillus sp. BR1-192]
MAQLLDAVDQERLAINPSLKRKSELGQFLTPSSIASFMASLFDKDTMSHPNILDAGAGIGSLTCAFLSRLVSEGLSNQAAITAVEIDEILREKLFNTLSLFEDTLNLNSQVIAADYIEWATNVLLDEESLLSSSNNKIRFSHAILNPPYKKIMSNSRHRKLLRGVGIETVNLYSAFVALTIELMEDHGQIVAIIPRSFCNGPYFRPFRQLLLEKTAIKHMHLFDSRDKAFKDDEVLQENVIMLLERGEIQGEVQVSTSRDDSFSDYEVNCYPFEKIVQPKDSEFFIHIPTSNEESFIERYPSVCFSLKEIGVEVSTGPVVDFRVKGHLRDMPEDGTVPLFYPNHFVGTLTEWPKVMKKPNAVFVDDEMKKWLYPNGYYTVVKRFSSKEEKRRIVAGVLTPSSVNYAEVGFENGLNVLHYQKQGIPAELAFGLYAYLNSTEVDKYFRVFNGHTQVNATDLRTMKFPSREKLEKFGRWVMSNSDTIGQEEIDQKLEEIL